MTWKSTFITVWTFLHCLLRLQQSYTSMDIRFLVSSVDATFHIFFNTPISISVRPWIKIKQIAKAICHINQDIFTFGLWAGKWQIKEVLDKTVFICEWDWHFEVNISPLTFPNRRIIAHFSLFSHYSFTCLRLLLRTCTFSVCHSISQSSAVQRKANCHQSEEDRRPKLCSKLIKYMST